MITQAEVLECAEKIKNFCDSYSTCDGCPFQTIDETCSFRDEYPTDWSKKYFETIRNLEG